jgi:hypothetical protein
VGHYVPAFLALLGILFNLSMLIVTARKMCWFFLKYRN